MTDLQFFADMLRNENPTLPDADGRQAAIRRQFARHGMIATLAVMVREGFRTLGMVQKLIKLGVETQDAQRIAKAVANG